MKIVINEKTYIAPRPKTRLFRQALVITNEKDLNNLTPDTLDELIKFVCDLFANEFSIDDIYDHYYGDELYDLLLEALTFAMGGKASAEDKKK